MNPLPQTRREAVKTGVKRYLGKECKYGHHSGRLTSNKACTDCVDIHNRSKLTGNEPEWIGYGMPLGGRLSCKAMRTLYAGRVYEDIAGRG